MTAPTKAERCGDYELVRYLTAGGMADLYLARSPKHPGELVVKRIQPRFVEYTRVVKMFIDEGRIAQALEHPNIVKIVDVGQEQGNYFIAMEYIAGKDLLAICRRGVEVGNFLPRQLAVALVAQALRGLQHAHQKQGPDGQPLRVVHCDISPGNIVVSWGGTAKIVDFGIARATIQLRNEDHSVAGKYNYMAPEQIKGLAVDARADLFAMGTILYELTCGKRLFRGRPEQVMRLVIDEPIAAPASIRPDYPPALEAIVLRALERDPLKRWDSARQMREALLAWLREQAQPFDKREVAAYLRDIFGAEKMRESEEFGAEAGEEELVLEKGLPRSVSGLHVLPLRVDPEDPEDETAAPPAAAEPIAAAPAPSVPVAAASPSAPVAAASLSAPVAAASPSAPVAAPVPSAPVAAASPSAPVAAASPSAPVAAPGAPTPVAPAPGTSTTGAPAPGRSTPGAAARAEPSVAAAVVSPVAPARIPSSPFGSAPAGAAAGEPEPMKAMPASSEVTNKLEISAPVQARSDDITRVTPKAPAEPPRAWIGLVAGALAALALLLYFLLNR